jgi:hypothetical protein
MATSDRREAIEARCTRDRTFISIVTRRWSAIDFRVLRVRSLKRKLRRFDWSRVNENSRVSSPVDRQMSTVLSLLDERRCHRLSTLVLIGGVCGCGNNWKREKGKYREQERDSV